MEIHFRAKFWRVLPTRQVFKLYPKSRAENLSLKLQGADRNNGETDKDLYTENTHS